MLLYRLRTPVFKNNSPGGRPLWLVLNRVIGWQVFDRDGVFKFHFGACGKHDGQLLYPNRVAVCRVTGDIIVTERSPTHQVKPSGSRHCVE